MIKAKDESGLSKKKEQLVFGEHQIHPKSSDDIVFL